MITQGSYEAHHAGSVFVTIRWFIRVCALLTGSWSSELWQEPGKKLELVSVDSYYLENSGVRKPLLFVSV